MKVNWMKEYLFYAGISREEYQRVQPEVQRHNKSKLCVFLLITLVFLSVMTFLSVKMEVVRPNCYAYLSSLLVTALVFLITVTCKKMSPRMLSCMMTVFTSTLLLLGIFVGTYTYRDERTTTFIVFLLALPMLFTRRPLDNIIQYTFFNVIFVIAATLLKDERVMSTDVINAVIFGGISIIVSSYMMNIMMENYVMKYKLTNMAKIDSLTQLQNRNWYEQQLKTYPSRCQKSLTCIYVDMNGLHEINNTQGHAVGDQMLKVIAKEFQVQFGEKHTYRIGGDEYIAFAIDMQPEALTQKVDNFTRKVEENQYFVAIGCVTQKVGQINMDELVKSTEEKMYSMKTSFYQQHNHERSV